MTLKIITVIAIVFMMIFTTHSQWNESWATTSNWTGTSVDGAVELKVSGGNVFVTGNNSHSDSGWAISTIKYNSSGVQQWKTLYRNSSNPVFASGIQIDNSGNVYVVGTKYAGSNGDFLTIKYNSSGVQQWAVTYDGGGVDRGNAIAIDNSGNIYVTGGSDSAGTMNIFTIKYNSSGTQQWARHFNKAAPLGNTFGNDEAFAITLDTNSSRVGFGYGLYVVGWYDDGNNCAGPIDTLCKHDAQIVHYTFDGVMDGARHYGCGPDNAEDWANDVVVSDVTGNVYSVGSKWCKDATHSLYGNQFMVMKCYWDVRNDPPEFKMDYPYCSNARYFNPDVDGGSNVGYSLVVENTDAGDLVYATGYGEGKGTSLDYLTIKFNNDGSHAWVSRFDSPNSDADIASSIVMNDSYVFVTGMAGDPSYSDIATVQYDKAGNQICVAMYNGGSDLGDAGRSIGLDGSSVFVAGIINESENLSNQSDFITLNYGESECGDNHFKTLTNSESKGEYKLSQNFPNPFNPTTSINYSIPKSSFVTLKIYNVLGQYVLFIPSKYLGPGKHSEFIDASSLASGVYFYEIIVKDGETSSISFRDVKKMFLIK